MVPTLRPGPVLAATGVAVAAPVAGAELASAAGEPEEEVELVWASAEIVNKTAAAKVSRRSLLVMGLLALLGTARVGTKFRE